MKSKEAADIVVGTFIIINNGIADKVTNVCLDAITLFISTLNSPYYKNNQLKTQAQKTQYGFLINTITDRLLAKAGDNNAKLKQAANEALDLAAKHPLLGGIMIIERILLQREDTQIRSS